MLQDGEWDILSDVGELQKKGSTSIPLANPGPCEAPVRQCVSVAAACEPPELMNFMFPWSRTMFLFGLPNKLSSGSCSGGKACSQPPPWLYVAI